MTNYINWMQANQIQASGDTLPIQGNPSGDTESPATSVASGVAPLYTNYASIWATVPFKVSATNLTDSNGVASTLESAYPANTVVEIPNVTPSKTTITMTDL